MADSTGEADRTRLRQPTQATQPARPGQCADATQLPPSVSARDADATLLSGTGLEEGATLLRDPGATPHVPRATGGEVGVGSVVHEWYRLESLLGVGAMGQVWKALDLQRQRAGDPHPHVALKLVSHEFAQHERAMVAMQREASKVQQLAHPNIGTAYVFAEDPVTGQCYLAMELLEGKPLDRLIADHPGGLPRAKALGYVRGLATGLAYAHAKGIVHCDFKPGNAFITDGGVAKVLDFGIARLAQGVAQAGDSFDAGELNALTPAYASLEMVRGEAPHPADDVYALGLVAYEALSGHHPFGRHQADEVLSRRLKAAPIKGLRRTEWHAIERALRISRKERWPDAAAFLKALTGIAPWVPALAGLAAVLALSAGYLGYRNYVESQPSVPFEQLSAEVREQFAAAMAEGDRAYAAATQVLAGDEALAAVYQDALGRYAAAYDLHPRNREADAALKRSLGFLDERLDSAEPVVRDEAHGFLLDLQRNHKSLAKYAPLDELVRQTD
jgi:serine/threonine protein kinase